MIGPRQIPSAQFQNLHRLLICAEWDCSAGNVVGGKENRAQNRSVEVDLNVIQLSRSVQPRAGPFSDRQIRTEPAQLSSEQLMCGGGKHTKCLPRVWSSMRWQKIHVASVFGHMEPPGGGHVKYLWCKPLEKITCGLDLLTYDEDDGNPFMCSSVSLHQ